MKILIPILILDLAANAARFPKVLVESDDRGNVYTAYLMCCTLRLAAVNGGCGIVELWNRGKFENAHLSPIGAQRKFGSRLVLGQRQLAYAQVASKSPAVVEY